MHFIRRFLAEREAFIGIVIFGVLVMLADIFSDLEWHGVAAVLRVCGIAALLVLLILDNLFRYHRHPIAVPLIFTMVTDRTQARQMLDALIESQRINFRVVEELTGLGRMEFAVRLDFNPRSQPDPQNPQHWEKGWRELLREWEVELDRRLKQSLPVGETFCYHIHPHLWLPLAFALGASVDLRRPIVLYHRQQEQFYRVLDLTNPRILFGEPQNFVPQPEKVPPDFDTLPAGGKLILHMGITDRHDFPEFSAHPDHANAVNACLVYRKALDPKENWLGYVQWLYREARPLLGRYQAIEICLVCPSAVAFALGMAFSRTPKITVCDHQDGKYVPVFSLSEIERKLPFD